MKSSNYYQAQAGVIRIMGITDRRKPLENINIDQSLIEEGTAQLNSEIEVLENWLQELEPAGSENSEAVAARKSYNDMLRSRKEMLTALQNQAGMPAAATDH